MPKFKKKSLIIEARQFLGKESARDILEWVGDNCRVMYHVETEEPFAIEIATLEGTMITAPGWWIIKGIKGEFYPCDPTIFEESYDEVRDEAAIECESCGLYHREETLSKVAEALAEVGLSEAEVSHAINEMQNRNIYFRESR